MTMWMARVCEGLARETIGAGGAVVKIFPEYKILEQVVF